MKNMTQAELVAKKKEMEQWVKRFGLNTVMRNVAHRLLPDIKFTFQLNLGGGSYTDGKKVVVGIPELTWGMDKKEVISVTKALVGHESEHVWSSDFKVFVQFQEDVKKYFKTEYNFDITGKLGAHLLNSTEDGRIEKRLINRYRGYKKHVQFMNGLFWKEQPVQGQNEMMEFLYCITSMCVTGLKSKDWDKFYGGTRQDMLLDEIRPLIIRAINSPTAQGCADHTMELMRVIAPYMHELLQDLKNQQEMEKELRGEPDFSSSNPQEGAESQPGNSQSSHFLPEDEPEPQKGNGEGKEGEESDDDSDDENKSKSKSKSSKKDEKDEDKDGKGEGDADESEQSDEESDDDSKGGSSSKSDKEEDEKEGDSNGSDSSDDSDEESGEDADGSESGDDADSDEKEGDDSDASDNGSDDPDSSDDPASTNIPDEDQTSNLTSEQIEELVEQAMADQKEDINEDAQGMLNEGEQEVARQEAIDRKENEYKGHLAKEDMRKLDKSVDFVNRNPEKKRSTRIPTDVKTNGQYLNKELKKILMNKQTYTSKNRRAGILDTGALWKKGVRDNNMFMKRGVPNDTSIAVNIIVDYSGSMSERVDRQGNTKLDMAIRAVATIEEGLKGLVPHRISFFSATGGSVMHSTVKDFNQESKDTLSWSRIPNIPDWGNRDGYSINVGALEVLKRSERTKMLIVLSDGLPSYPGGISGQREVKEAVREARKNGVTVISIAFGSESEMKQNAEVYREMYQKGIIMVHPSEIHKELAKVIKNELSR